MARGRPPKGIGHVDGLSGSRESKRRLRIILQTLTGERTIEQARKTLMISTSRFHQLRRQALEGAIEGLEHQSPGRPQAPTPDRSDDVARLEAELQDTKIDLQASRVQTEIALTMPHLLRDRKKKTVRKGRKKP